MAAAAAAAAGRALPRVFENRPTPYDVNRIKEEILRTASPETHPDLFQNKIRRDTPYVILAKISIDPKKRRDSLRVDCPMCQPRKFYDGRLVWLPDYQRIAFIGHCCADKHIAEQANIEFEAEQRKERDIEFLIESLPLLTVCRETIEQAAPIVQAADWAVRQLRRSASSLCRDLDHASRANNGVLSIDEMVRADSEEAERHNRGPTTRTTHLGMLRGRDVLRGSIYPNKLLDAARARLPTLNLPDDGAVIDHLLTLEDAHDERTALCASLRCASTDYRTASLRTREIQAFFHPENLRLVLDWSRRTAGTSATRKPQVALFRPMRNAHGLRYGDDRVHWSADLYLDLPQWPLDQQATT